MKTTSPQAHYDVVIIGGGLVGASLACALQAAIDRMRTGVRAQPLRVLVTEAAAHVDASPSFDARSTALSYGSQRIYQGLGLWDRLAPHATPIKHIHVSDRGHFGAVRLDSETMNVEALGQVIENRHLGEALMQALTSAPDIDYLCPARIVSASHTPAGMALTVAIPEMKAQAKQQDQTREISASLVVLADGGKSTLCQQLGIGMRVEHYGQKAIIANVAFEKPHENVAYERFTDSGPLAVLPLADLAGDHRGALIWTLTHEDADVTIGLSDDDFLAALQERFGHRLGMFEKVGRRASYPLSLTVAQEQVRPGLVLLGNVAHTLHPVAGQGLNLALRDAESLAGLIMESYRGKDGETVSPGTMSVLQRFVDSQQADQNLTIDFSHYMTRLFSSTNPGLVWARKFGMFSVDLLPVVKRGFARQAMGMGERLRRTAG